MQRGDVYDFHLHLQAHSVSNRRWWNEVIVYMHGEDGQSSGIRVCDLQKLQVKVDLKAKSSLSYAKLAEFSGMHY